MKTIRTEIINSLRLKFLQTVEDTDAVSEFNLMVLDKFEEMELWVAGDRKILVEVKCTAVKCSHNEDGFCQNETINLELDHDFREGCRRPDTTTYSAECEDCDIPTKVHKP